jgi:hypothetical protein
MKNVMRVFGEMENNGKYINLMTMIDKLEIIEHFNMVDVFSYVEK